MSDDKDKEIAAWRTRFPQYEYRRMDDVVALKFIPPDDSKISVNMLTAIKVVFLRPIFEDDFPERGMTAWLTRVERDDHDDYKLFFDFSQFEDINDKYFSCSYFPNAHTKPLNMKNRTLFTAKEANQYSPKYTVHFYARNDEEFEKEIRDYLQVIN